MFNFLFISDWVGASNILFYHHKYNNEHLFQYVCCVWTYWKFSLVTKVYFPKFSHRNVPLENVITKYILTRNVAALNFLKLVINTASDYSLIFLIYLQV